MTRMRRRLGVPSEAPRMQEGAKTAISIWDERTSARRGPCRKFLPASPTRRFGIHHTTQIRVHCCDPDPTFCSDLDSWSGKSRWRRPDEFISQSPGCRQPAAPGHDPGTGGSVARGDYCPAARPFWPWDISSRNLRIAHRIVSSDATHSEAMDSASSELGDSSSTVRSRLRSRKQAFRERATSASRAEGARAVGPGTSETTCHCGHDGTVPVTSSIGVMVPGYRYHGAGYGFHGASHSDHGDGELPAGLD
jgi:hypothetical protein